MTGEQLPLFEVPTKREFIIERYNQLTEEKWDLLDQIAALDLGRVALAYSLREAPHGSQ